MSTDVGSAASAEEVEPSTIDMALEVVTLPVSDVDRAMREDGGRSAAGGYMEEVKHVVAS
jgi:hypothetical protein